MLKKLHFSLMSASLKAVEGLSRWHAIWLGGIKLDNKWQWADDATWRFTNWRHDPPKKYIYLLMKTDGLWSDYMGSDQNYFLCQGATVALTKSGSATIELGKDQLAFFPFHVLFKSVSTGSNSSL